MGFLPKPVTYICVGRMQTNESMPYDKRDDESGKFAPEFSDEDFLTALRDRGGATTSDVADAVGCKYRTAYSRLNRLVDDGRVERREIGNSFLWEPADEDAPETSGSERRETAAEPAGGPADPSVATDAAGHEGGESDVEADVPPEAEAAIEDLDLPGDGDLLAARRAAIGEMYALLREREGDIVETSDLKAQVDPDRVGYGSVDSFWANALKADSSKGRQNALTALPGVAELGNGRYRYTAGGDQ